MKLAFILYLQGTYATKLFGNDKLQFSRKCFRFPHRNHSVVIIQSKDTICCSQKWNDRLFKEGELWINRDAHMATEMIY